MLPQIHPENQLRTFKFWFNGGVQDGVHYQNELYYRAKMVPIGQRAQLYRVACRLADHNADLLVSSTEKSSSLWISLRNQKLAAMTLQQATRLPADNLLPRVPARSIDPADPN